MLTRRSIRSRLVAGLLAVAVAVAGGVAVAVLFGGGTRAIAGGSGSCPKEISWCTVHGRGGGGGGDGGGSGGDGGGDGGCSYRGVAVPCYIEGLGYYNNACYFRREDPQPPQDDPKWAGRTEADGAFYMVTCYDAPPPWGTGTVDPVEEFIKTGDAGPTPLELAEEALAAIRLDEPTIEIAPSPDGVGGLVGLPVWMAIDDVPHAWGPLHNSASSGALTVTITAVGYSIAWNMGDGTTVTCTNPGTIYKSSFGDRASPNCGYVYRKPSYSRAHGKYTITATTTWHVHWTGGGTSGTIVTTRLPSQTSIRINEAQVVVK